MKFKRMKRSSLRVEWMRDYPFLTRIYAFTVLFWGPVVITVALILENRKEYSKFYEEAVGAVFLENDYD